MPLPFAHDDVVRLGPRLDLQLDVPAEARRRDRAAERRLDHADRHLAVDVELVALEPRVGLDLDHHVEVAGRAALGPAHPAVADAQRLAVVDARRDADLERALLLHRAGARAGGARLGDHLAGALAARAGRLDREEALAVDHLAVAAAGLAVLRLGARGRTAAAAVLAGVAAGDGDLALAAGDRLGERDADPDLEVGASLGSAAAAAAEPAEQVAEHVAEPGEDLVRALEPAAEALPPWRVVTVLVVELALAVVAQHLERLGRLLEPLLGLLVARVAVRVVLHRHLAVRPLDVRRRCAALDAQNLVIVAFCGHRRVKLNTGPRTVNVPTKTLPVRRGRDRPSVW
jgi:hypothetical protein